MRSEYVRLAELQCAIMIIGATLAYFVVTSQAARSVAYGSGVALLGTLYLAWKFGQGGEVGGKNPSAEWCLRQAYQTAIGRFVLIIFLLAAGFKLLELAPLWILAGFVGGQSAWLVVPVWTRLRTQNDK